MLMASSRASGTTLRCFALIVVLPLAGVVFLLPLVGVVFLLPLLVGAPLLPFER